MNKLLMLVAFGMLTLFFSACNKDKKDQSEQKKDSLLITYKIKSSWAHNEKAFTQGLVIHNGQLYESTGQEQSWIGIIDVNTGNPDKKVVLDNQYFGEGITIMNNKVYQLTWQSKKGFVYDLNTFKKLREFEYNSEGWGITHDDSNLIMSDGTEKLIFLDTTTLKPVKTVAVKDENGPVKNLNELEYVNGYVFANIWQTNNIVKIDPASGKVVGRIDFSTLAQDAHMRNPQADVLNGIAYHPTTKLFLITGKNWPRIYVVQLNQSNPL